MTPNRSSTSAGATTTGLLSKAPALLRSIYATNNNATIRYLLIFDLNRVPVSGDVPKMAFPLYASSSGPSEKSMGADTWGLDGTRGFESGLSWGVSGSINNYDGTATAADHSIIVVGANF